VTAGAPPDNEKPGYGRPPRHAQFKPGQSGNRKGRPKGSKSFGTILVAVLNQKVSVRGARGIRQVTVREAMLMKFTENALKGDPRALLTLIALDEKSRAGERVTGPRMPVPAEDLALLNSFFERTSKEASINEGESSK
jgi:hypothetical protein